MSRYSSGARPSDEDRPLLSPQACSGDSSSSLNRFQLEHDVELDDLTVTQYDSFDADMQFGGPEARAKLEKKLLKKLDARMSILVIIYILNCKQR